MSEWSNRVINERGEQSPGVLGSSDFSFFPVAPRRAQLLSDHVSQLMFQEALSLGRGACGGDDTQWAAWPESGV